MTADDPKDTQTTEADLDFTHTAGDPVTGVGGHSVSDRNDHEDHSGHVYADHTMYLGPVAQVPATHSHDNGTHTDHTGHETVFRRRFWVSLFLSVPVIVFSEFVQIVFGYVAPTFPGSWLIVPVLSIVIFAYGGLPFLSMAQTELSNREPGMMMLISLAISVAFAYSVASLFLPGTTPFFWELVTLIDIMLLGHWMEMRSVRQASGALDELAKLMPDTAERITESGDTEKVPVSTLTESDVVLVRPGASVPADGEVVEGDSEHMIARAIRDVAAKRGVQRAAVVRFENLRGIGVTATVDRETVHLGGPNLIEELGIDRSESIERFANEAGANAQTEIYLIVQESEVVAAFALADVIREESRRAIKGLHAMRIDVTMLTGDSEDVAKAVAGELGIDKYFAEVLPDEKDTEVEQLQAEGKLVAMGGTA